MGILLTLSLPSASAFMVTGLDASAIPHRWVLGSHGPGAHCPDCLELDGEVRTLDEWMNSIMPGSSDLHCGSGCRCNLEPTVSLPTRFTLFIPGRGDAHRLSRLYLEAQQMLRADYSFGPQAVPPRANVPPRTPAGSLPASTAAERRPWWDKPSRKQTIHGVD